MEALNGVLEKYGKIIEDECVKDIRSKKVTKYGAVNASGKLAASIRYEVGKDGLTVLGLDYSYYVEHGRKGGKKYGRKGGKRNGVKRSDSPFRKAIREWIDAKGIIPNKISKDSLAYLIQRKIEEEGTVAYRQGGTKLFEDILNQKLKSDIQNDLILSFKNIVISQMKSSVVKNV